MKSNIHFFKIISRPFLLRMRNVSDKSCRENQNTRFVFSNFFWKSCRLRDKVESGAGHRWRHGACVLHAGYQSLPTHTQNTQYWLLFHYNNRCSNAPERYVIRTLAVFFFYNFSSTFTHFNRLIVLLRNVFTLYVKTYHIFAKTYRLPVSYWGI
jgi:hypothetical protein